LTTAPLASTGLVGSSPEWLDVQFGACQDEYEAMLRSVGMRPGWRVLDAGCGSGAYLPLLAGLVGSCGSLAAIDLAPENVAAVEVRLGHWQPVCAISTRIGSVLSLPYPAAHFDAIWCSNTLQYLSDNNLATAFVEFRRVLRQGGLVAIKESEPSLAWLEPAPPYVIQHRLEARLPLEHWDALRERTLRAAFAQAGLVETRFRSTLVERRAPLRPVEQQYYRERLAYLAATAHNLDLPDADHKLWQGLEGPASTDHLVEHPDFYMREGHIVAVGRLPDAR
jgi:SAM-dependent methyltransferase